MMIAKTKVIAFARITGKEFIIIPQINQRKAPEQSIININKDMSLVDFVFQTLITWGKKASDVKVPAAKPINSVYATFKHPDQ